MQCYIISQHINMITCCITSYRIDIISLLGRTILRRTGDHSCGSPSVCARVLVCCAHACESVGARASAGGASVCARASVP